MQPERAQALDLKNDPAMRDWAVHFVGRARTSATPLPSEFVEWPASRRLASILWTGTVRGYPAPQAFGRIAAFSDVSAAELVNAFAGGLNSNGACEPWALVVRRDLLWDAGVRPVLYVDQDEASDFQVAVGRIRGQAWQSLVQPTRLTWTPSTSKRDWTHEREWRMCWSSDEPAPALDISSAAVAVVVGESGWSPDRAWPNDEPLTPPYAATRHTLQYTVMRWLYRAQTQDLVDDGRLVVPPLAPQAAGR